MVRLHNKALDYGIIDEIIQKKEVKMKKEPIWGSKGEEESNHFSNSNNQITNVDNHIYFYSEVERPKMLELNKKLNELDVKLQTTSLKLEHRIT